MVFWIECLARNIYPESIMARHNIVGRIGEAVAAKYLGARGYVVLSKNEWRRFGELDLVARSPGGELVLFEVKTLVRWNEGSERALAPEDNFSWAKERKTRKMAEFFVNRHPELVSEEKGWQTDLLAITITNPKVLENEELTYNEKDFVINHYENI